MSTLKRVEKDQTWIVNMIEASVGVKKTFMLNTKQLGKGQR